MLNADIICLGRTERDNAGIPQGGILAPILFNIYLHQLDIFIRDLQKEEDLIGGSVIKTNETQQAY